MQYLYKVCFCCAFLVVLLQATLADKEDKSDETSEVHESTEVAEEGPPDSHEAMNNREINPITKTRQKRSYEFLMGLINNNSRYQVTRDEPEINLSKKQGESDDNVGASEILLELMVKIAGNPEQWNKVHHLLRQIDQDILTSKQVVENYQNHTMEMQNLLQEDNYQKDNLQLDKKQDSSSTTTEEKKKKKKYTQEEINKEVAITSDNGQPDINTSLFVNSAIPTPSTKEWPTFPDEDTKVNFVKTDSTDAPWNNNLVDQTKPSNTGSSTTKPYPKYFSYHRVTGKPVFINKNPKAYIAVSVLAPKSDVRTNEDLELEHELRQLKPWSHSQNLKNMASIRSRWVIDGDRDRKTSEGA